jgi:outer membrane lipoprotein-sorting protein
MGGEPTRMLSRTGKFGQAVEAKTRGFAGRKTQACMALLALLALVYPSPAAAATSDLDTVLTASRQRIEKLDYRISGRLTRVEGNGKRTTYKFVGKAHWFPDGLRLLCEVTGANSEKTVLVLHMSEAGQLTMEALLPGAKTATALPFERWNEPLAGTDFSFEDMVESQFFWKSQELGPREKFGARDCFVLKSKAASQDRSHYDSVTTWIDSTILFPVHVVKTMHGSGQQKEFISYGLRHTGGVWSATQLEVKQQGKTGSSMLVIEGGSAKANLARKDFEIGPPGAPDEKVK